MYSYRKEFSVLFSSRNWTKSHCRMDQVEIPLFPLQGPSQSGPISPLRPYHLSPSVEPLATSDCSAAPQYDTSTLLGLGLYTVLLPLSGIPFSSNFFFLGKLLVSSRSRSHADPSCKAFSAYLLHISVEFFKSGMALNFLSCSIVQALMQKSLVIHLCSPQHIRGI